MIMQIRVGFIVVLATLAGCWSSARAVTFHVDASSTAELAEADGSPGRPYKTIVQAARVALAGDVVLIHPGTYAEDAIRATHSGKPDQPIIFQAMIPGTAIITAGEKADHYTRQESPLQFGPPMRLPANQELWAGAQYITLRGLTFLNARGTAIGAGTGWTIEDCLISGANFDGIQARGDDITIQRTVVQECGHNGMTGGFGKNIVIRNCIIRRCNQFPDSAGGNAGASKFLYTRDMVVQGLSSYDNFGSGWWFDWDNRNYEISGSTIFANHAGVGLENGTDPVDQPWAGAGIWTEANPGPGHITANVVYSNVSCGIGILDSSNVIVDGNLVVDCGTGVEFRDMNRDNKPEEQRQILLNNVIVRNNRFKAWRGDAAMSTSIGEFKRGDRPLRYNMILDANVYEPIEGKALLKWMDRKGYTLEELQNEFGCEDLAKTTQWTFLAPLIPTHSTGADVLKSDKPDRLWQVDAKSAEADSLDAQLAKAELNREISLHVYGRRMIQGTTPDATCIVYDLAAGRQLTLHLTSDAAVDALTAAVTPYTRLIPATIKVKITRLDPYDYEGELVVEDKETDSTSSPTTQESPKL